MKKKVIIIGSGIGGLGSAALLSKSGYDVTVVEKNTSIGGRANIFEAEGYTFDMDHRGISCQMFLSTTSNY